MRLGTATVDITPREPCALAGFAARLEPYDDVREPLSAQVLAFGSSRPGPASGASPSPDASPTPGASLASGASVDPPADAVLVCADLLWWGPDLVARLGKRVEADFGLPAERLVLHASHTHCAPQPGETFSPLVGAPDPGYLAYLEKLTVEAIGRALADLAAQTDDVELRRGVGRARIAANRRRINPDGSVGGPDLEAPVDNDVVTLAFRTPDGLRALLVHHACHPVVSDARRVGPDFPGAMRRRLASDLGRPEVTIGFLQGCCGDLDPLLVRDGNFYRGDDAELEDLGGRLADAALAGLADDAPVAPALVAPIEPETGTGTASAGPPATPDAIRVRTLEAPLPLQVLSRATLARMRSRQGIEGDWSSWLLAEPGRITESIPIRLTVLELAESLVLLGFDAEVTSPYGFALAREYAGTVLPIGYTNGMIGYVVTADQVRAGGYEPDESYLYVYRPGRFAPAAEEALYAAIATALER